MDKNEKRVKDKTKARIKSINDVTKCFEELHECPYLSYMDPVWIKVVELSWKEKAGLVPARETDSNLLYEAWIWYKRCQTICENYFKAEDFKHRESERERRTKEARAQQNQNRMNRR